MTHGSETLAVDDPRQRDLGCDPLVAWQHQIAKNFGGEIGGALESHIIRRYIDIKAKLAHALRDHL